MALTTTQPAPLPALRPLIISAPFGNYIQPAGATATLGTFTAAPRPGRLIQILRTVRYYRRLRAWVNRIGLRNPGIDWLVSRTNAGRVSVDDKIISIHGFTADDWRALLEKTAAVKPSAIELNMSCPNVGELNFPSNLFKDAAAAGPPIIVKLPPVNYHDLFDHAVAAGLRCFHCCNTLPVPAGGLSGKPLKPVALQCIRDLLDRAARLDSTLPAQLLIIGGGGIRAPADIDDYDAAGARRFAVATLCFNPRLLFSHALLQPLVDHAHRAMSVRGERGVISHEDMTSAKSTKGEPSGMVGG